MAPSVRKPRIAVALVATSLCVALAPAPAASAAGDPVKSGSLRLQMTKAFKKRLAKGGVRMSPRSFAIRSGAIDPLAGTGEVSLAGALRFKRKGEKLVFKNLTATLGQGGALRSGKIRLFELSSGSVARKGFGAEIGGMRLKLLRPGARKLRRKLDHRSMRAGFAGSVAVSEQPKTVEVTTGTGTLTPDMTPAGLAAKFEAHCIDSATGVSVLAPGSQPGGAGTPYLFPVTGGTVSPEGLEGVVQQAGGIELRNGGAGLPAGCPGSGTVTIRQSDLAVDLKSKWVTSRIAISGPGAPFGIAGELNVSFPYDAINSTFSADPVSHTVTTNGTVLKLNSAAAYYLNQAFPQPSGSFDPSLEFASGDSYGVASLTLQVR